MFTSLSEEQNIKFLDCAESDLVMSKFSTTITHLVGAYMLSEEVKTPPLSVKATSSIQQMATNR
jgi:hypothetical protein